MKKNNKNNQSEMIQIHGKTEVFNRPNSPTSLDEILGENLSIYTASSVEEYESQLAEMNATDLQAHAYRVGLIPTSERKVLSDRLVNEFKKWISRYVGNPETTANAGTSAISKKAQKILREGA